MRMLRARLGVSQEALAEQLEVSRNYLSMIENGRTPSRRFANRLERMERQCIVADCKKRTDAYEPGDVLFDRRGAVNGGSPTTVILLSHDPVAWDKSGKCWWRASNYGKVYDNGTKLGGCCDAFYSDGDLGHMERVGKLQFPWHHQRHVNA